MVETVDAELASDYQPQRLLRSQALQAREEHRFVRMWNGECP